MKNEEHQFDQSDLDWLAFCYVTGELDPPQLEAFETRLASDQAARESIVRVMAQNQFVYEALATESACSKVSLVTEPDDRSIPTGASAPSFFRSASRPAPAWLAAAAAVLLIATVWQWSALSDFSPAETLSMVDLVQPTGSFEKDVERVANERLADAWIDAISKKNIVDVESDSELLSFGDEESGYSDVVFETEGWLIDAIENDSLNESEMMMDSTDMLESPVIPGSGSNHNLIPFSKGTF